MRRALELARRRPARRQPAGRRRDPLRRRRRARRRAGTAAPARSHAEVDALSQLAAGSRARRDRGRHPRAVQPHRPHRSLLGGASSPPASRASIYAVRRPRSRVHRRSRAAARSGRRGRGGTARRWRPPSCSRPGSTVQRLGRPHVTVKWAQSLDGRAAAADGTSQWITGAEARADVHRRRAGADAIVVGTGTVLADDPALTARQPDGTLLRQPADPRRARRRAECPTAPRCARHPRPAAATGRAHDLTAVLERAARPRRAARLRRGRPDDRERLPRATDLADEVLAYVAPTLIGYGADGADRPHSPTSASTRSPQQRRLAVASVESLGDDLLIVAQPLAEGNP